LPAEARRNASAFIVRKEALRHNASMRKIQRPLSAVIAGHEPRDARMLRDLLDRLGIGRIDAAADGKAAIAALAGTRPDLLVVDWSIAARSAGEVVAAARDGADHAPRIVVTMTAPTRSAVEAAKALEVDSIVAMPFSPRMFMDRIPRLDRP
jgi:CheY-like chemotaxis protein